MNLDRSIALESFSSESYLCINKNLLKKFGPVKAIFISNLIDKYKYFLDKNKLMEDDSFFLTNESQIEQTGISLFQLKNCKKELKEKGIIETKMKGIPPKEFYIIHFDRLLEIALPNIRLKTDRIIEEKLTELPVKNLPNIKENRYKENRYKENRLLSANALRQKSSFSPEDLVSLWNKKAKDLELPSVLKLNTSRRNKIKTRCESPDLTKPSDWKNLFDQIDNCPFLLGENDRGWTVDFDWIIDNDKNYIKILEGKYQEKKKPTRTKSGRLKSPPGKYDDLPGWRIENGKRIRVGEDI